MTSNFAMDFYMTPGTQAAKEKTDKLDFMRLKIFVFQMTLSRN